MENNVYNIYIYNYIIHIKVCTIYNIITKYSLIFRRLNLVHKIAEIDCVP